MNLRNWLIKKLGGCTSLQLLDHGARMHSDGVNSGIEFGKRQAKIDFALLPLPFTADQLRGREYGTFITPAGFAHTFGECNIPAPGQHGYEMHAGYVRKGPVHVENIQMVYSDVAENEREHFIPVIIVVLR